MIATGCGREGRHGFHGGAVWRRRQTAITQSNETATALGVFMQKNTNLFRPGSRHLLHLHEAPGAPARQSR